jgi:hypothetical protein
MGSWSHSDMAGTVTKSKADTGADRQIAVVGDWAILTDGQQWILARRWKDGKWRGLSFVRSTRDVLARCLREKGAHNALAAELLAGLPQTFDDWKASQAFPGAVSADTAAPPTQSGGDDDVLARQVSGCSR